MRNSHASTASLLFPSIYHNTKLLVENTAAIKDIVIYQTMQALSSMLPLALYKQLPYVQLVNPGNAPRYPPRADDVT